MTRDVSTPIIDDMRFFTGLPGDILQCLTFVAAHPIPVAAGALALAIVVGVAHAIRKGI